MKNRNVYIFLFCLISCFAFGQTSQQISNQNTFAKLFGYVRYFHPSDEASEIDWDKFAVYASSEIDKCESREEFKKTLNNLFLPIAPSIKIFETNDDIQFNIAEITPDNKSKNFNVITWQHFGVGFDNDSSVNLYSSARTNRTMIVKSKADSSEKKVKHDLLFDKHAAFGEYIKKEIGSGLSCIVPIALYGDDENTFPASDSEKLNNLKKELQSVTDLSLSVNNLYLRLADVIITWNIFQHFYLYFDIAKTNWQEDLTIAITEAYNDKSENDFLLTLKRLTAKLKDGHIRVRSESFIKNNYCLPVKWEWIENKLVITSIFSDSIQIHKGDIVTDIDGIEAKEYFNAIEQNISAATKGWLEYRAEIESVVGYNNSEANLTISDADGIVKNISLIRNLSSKDYYIKIKTEVPDKIKKISDDIYYINLDGATDSAMNNILPTLVKCKSIIFDLRGYPSVGSDLINYLLTQKDTSKMWMRVPQIIYPDEENITGYQNFGWELEPKEPHLDAKIIFIIDGSAISYAESFMSFIEYYKLATIIGQPTAGTNGNVNPFTLPGGYKIYWTGMKVVKHDGSQHHGIGIQPDIFLSKTIIGVREGKDEFLDKAIELAKE